MATVLKQWDVQGSNTEIKKNNYVQITVKNVKKKNWLNLFYDLHYVCIV